jgi:PAS domain S-box-containing protein
VREALDHSRHQPEWPEGEALLSAILASATDYAIITTDLDGRVTSWNAGARNVLGWTEAEILSQPVAVIFTPADRAEGYPLFEMRTALAEGRAADERWHLRQDGSEFWAQGEMMPLKGPRGEAIGFLKILRDRTEQRLSSEAAWENAVFLQRVLESSNDCIKVLDLDGRLKFMSEGGKRVMEIDDFSKFVDCPWPDFWEDEGNVAAKAAVEKAKAGGIGRFQGFARTAKGTPRWWDVQVTPITGSSGKPERILSISRDITATRETAAALQASEERFRAAVQAVEGILWTNTPEGEMRGEQPGWASLTDQAYDEYQGFGWANAVHPDDAQPSIDAWREAVADRKPFVFEHRVRRHDGEWRQFSIRAIPALDPDGSIREWVGVHTDITERKAAQEALAQETKRLEILNQIGAHLASELDLDTLVQETTDAGVALTGAQFGAFFYNVLNEQGESYMLYALSGVPREAFSKFPMPRNTAVFHTTFSGEGVVRSDDITKDPRYGKSDTHHGMPKDHLPVCSYLAVPVISRSGEVLGGLFFGHERSGVFTEEHERLLTGIAGQAASAIDNARLYQASQHELAERKRAERMVQERSTRLEVLAEAIEKAPSAHSLEELMEIVGRAARRLSNADGVTIVLREGEQCFYAAEEAAQPLWKGQRFPMVSCISGWSMRNLKTEVVPDVREDARIPQEIYQPTFVRSLVMVPLVSDGEATAAIGAYWSDVHTPSQNEIATLEALARTAGAVLRRLQAEQALRSLNETLEAQVAARTADRDRMWRLSTDVMLVAQFDGTITATNPAWMTLFGWREEELLGRSFLDLVHPDDLESTRAEAGNLSQGITTLRFENRYRHKDGSYRWLSWIAVPDEDLIHAVGRDVTAEKEAEEALRQTEEALRQAQKMEAIGQLTGGIAHDFNNLLTGIVGSLDMMQTRIAQGRMETVDRYAKAAMTSAHRAAALTHRLLAFARRQPLDPRPVEVNRLVISMEDLLRRTLGEAIQMEFVMGGGLWLTRCDPNQLESAILNLAINARDAMPDGGRLTIETTNTHLDRAYAAKHDGVVPGQYVCIAVSDTGTGMPQDVVERAFDPFFTTKPIGQGTGLGLSMIYGFAKQSEGHVRIYSEEGQGTTIKIYLPRYQGAVEEAAEATSLTEAPRAEQGETVLLVEDEPVVRGLIVDVLRDLGYRALEAADGPSGLKILQSRRRIDLLVTDVGLPGLNGRQLADQARERRPDLKVLFITGYAENATVSHGFLDPGMEMVTKPFAIEDLAIRIREMIER